MRTFLRNYPSAGLLLLACVPLGLLVYATHVLLHDASARTHDLSVAASALPLALVALLTMVWHDLARARALHERAFASARSSLRALGPRAVVRALFLLGGGLSLTVCAASLVGSSGTSRLVGVLVLQGAAFARLFLRSCWLACILPEHAQAFDEE